MRLLLDTHIWVWAHLNPEKLSRRVAREIKTVENELWFSPISVWEVLHLVRKGRISLDAKPEAWIGRVLEKLPLREAGLNKEVAIESHRMDLPHRDPADRFLAATALVYELTLVTADERLLRTKSISLLANE